MVCSVRKLSSDFYRTYPRRLYPDILRKPGRAYNVVILDTCYDYLICIPFRSHITHDIAYKFQNSQRSQVTSSSLDYTKICIIKNMDYIDDAIAVVDQDEYNEMRNNIEIIVSEALDYIETYIKHETGEAVLSSRNYHRNYWYSTLKYFKRELGIESLN